MRDENKRETRWRLIPDSEHAWLIVDCGTMPVKQA
jgi:hypothetical protein